MPSINVNQQSDAALDVFAFSQEVAPIGIANC